MDLALSGRRALVTGASSGLGLGCAQALAAEGALVTLVARSAERLAAAAATIPARVHTLAFDLGELDGIGQLVADAQAAMGGVDIVIVNAGGPPAGNFASTPFERYQPALQLNLLSGVALCEAALPGMRQRGWGRIVAITSMSVREPMANLILSNTARAGFTAFLKTVATEVAADGVTVNTLQPGLHNTDRLAALYGGDAAVAAAGVPTHTLGDPTDFGCVAAFLCSDAAKFITGASIPVDGGALHGLQ
ncbi:MAG: SDR family oxidoreductase [Actinomycetota bacterium]|nr:SDR family oxidoreductase [Actinomycetota bacterium]